MTRQHHTPPQPLLQLQPLQQLPAHAYSTSAADVCQSWSSNVLLLLFKTVTYPGSGESQAAMVALCSCDNSP
jgi:hypothetical protein